MTYIPPEQLTAMHDHLAHWDVPERRALYRNRDIPRPESVTDIDKRYSVGPVLAFRRVARAT